MNRPHNIYTTAQRGLRRSFVLVALISALVNVLMLTGPIFMLQVYDRVLSSGSVATLQALFLLVIVLFGLLGFYDFLRVRILSRAAYRFDQEIGGTAFRSWLRSDTSARPLADLAAVRTFLPSPAMLGLFDAMWIPLYLGVLFLVHSWLGYLTIVGLAVVTLAVLGNQWLTRASQSQAMVSENAEGFLVEQFRRNAEAICPQGMANDIQRRWQHVHNTGLAFGQHGADRTEAFNASAKALRLLLQSALLALGGYLALRHEISAGMIVAASIIAGRALAPIDQVLGHWRVIARAREANRNLHALFADQDISNEKAELPAPTGALSVRGLTKLRPGKKPQLQSAPILRAVSFELSPGDALGVIGPSASGKSTLARLLVGAWTAESGDVRLDGAPLDQWDETALGNHIGYLPQQSELLAGTLRDNIARFRPDADDAQVIGAARLAGVHQMILDLPQGYMTEVGFGAAPLSGGQIQRLCLARAIFGQPRYVVLDEPNANLDAAGDDALGHAIRHMRGLGSTVVIMAHRPSAIAAVNKILILNNGQAAEFGDKDTVMRKAMRQQVGINSGIASVAGG